MHEITIARNIIEIVNDVVPEKDLSRIKTIKLNIGLMSNVLADSLKFGFDSLKSGTSFSSAELDINVSPIRIQCLDCSASSSEQDLLFKCPACGSSNIVVSGADDLLISEISLNN